MSDTPGHGTTDTLYADALERTGAKRQSTASKLSHWIERVLLPVLSWPAMLMLFAMMMITVCDVIGIKIIGSPLKGGIELTQLSLAVMIFCTFPLVCWDEAHVSVDLLDRFVPQTLVFLRRIVIHLMAAVALVLLSLKLQDFAARSMRYGDVTEFLRIPLGYLVYVMAGMGWLSAVISLLKAFVIIQAGRKQA